MESDAWTTFEFSNSFEYDGTNLLITIYCVGDKYEMTVYSSCCNTDRGIYYYTTYGNSTITAVDMNKEDLSGTSLSTYSLRKKCVIEREN